MTDAMERREDLLRRIMLEELDRSAPEVQDELAADPSFGERLDELDRLLATARGAGELEREILAAQAGETEAPGLEHVASVVAGALPRARAWNWRLIAWPLVAASLLIATWLILRDPRPSFPDNGGGTMLGTEELKLEYESSPAGWGVFRWAYEGAGTRFRLTVEDPTPDPPVVLHELATSKRSWRPSERDCEDWPEYVRWQVEVLDPLPEAPRAFGEARRSD